MKKVKISVIIPFYNERESIPDLVSALDQFCITNPEMDMEVLFVDDGSSDDSPDLLLKMKPQAFDGILIRLSRNFGSHAALRAGNSIAGGDFIVFLYADLQDPPSLIKELHDKTVEGYEIVWAQRDRSGIRLFHRLFSSLYAFLMRKFVMANFPPNGFDIVMYSQKVKQLLDRNIEANSSVFLQILTIGFKQTCIEYHRNKRLKGKSKWGVSAKIKLLIDSFVAFSYFPIRLVSLTGIAMFVIGFIWTLYIVLRKIILNDLSPGWPMLVAILLLGFGITNIALGIIAEYLWRTLDSTRNRPVFIIDGITRLNHS